MLPDRKEFFSLSDSLHSSLAARPIYSKWPKIIPMVWTSRNALLHVVSSQKSLPEQEHGLYLLIQIITGNLTKQPSCQIYVTSRISELSCPSANKNKDFSKVLSMGKSYIVAFLIAPSSPLHHTTAEAAIWEQTVSLLVVGHKRRRRRRWDMGVTDTFITVLHMSGFLEFSVHNAKSLLHFRDVIPINAGFLSSNNSSWSSETVSPKVRKVRKSFPSLLRKWQPLILATWWSSN